MCSYVLLGDGLLGVTTEETKENKLIILTGPSKGISHATQGHTGEVLGFGQVEEDSIKGKV